jgi:CRISPR type I-D-associated protein Csc2
MIVRKKPVNTETGFDYPAESTPDHTRIIDPLAPYLGSLDHLWDESSDGSNAYVHPKFQNLGSVSIVTLRESVAPLVVRGQEAEMTDLMVTREIDGVRTALKFVRATPNKFRHRDRAQGLKLLRHFGAGGRYPQNRHAIGDTDKLSDAFDMNCLVFGDSTNQGKKLYQVKGAVNYSDGLSLVPYEDAVAKTFHNRSHEGGVLFDPVGKQNSNNLFERHFVKPGTLFVQVVSTHGRMLPVEVFQHLMLSLGAAGTYGGQTSITGTNVRTHIVGIYASLVERAETAPLLIAERVKGDDVEHLSAEIHTMLKPVHEVSIDRRDAEAYRDGLIAELTSGSARLRESYQRAKGPVGELFGLWFTGKKVG